MKHISYPKIQQFRNVVSTVIRESEYDGLDEEGNAKFNKTNPKPTVTFKGTVKLHGTNASVCYNSVDGSWVQSRSNIITSQKDNAGFAFFAESKTVEFFYLLNSIIDRNNIDSSSYTTSIYGEWAGSGIQKNVGVSQLSKAFYIFGVKVSSILDESFNSYWLDSSDLRDNENGIYNIEDFQTYSVDVDFKNPQMSQNKFAEITEQVEKECPVSKSLGIEGGVGEGVVWSGEYNGSIHRFKVKGDKHSATKVKTLASVDVEKLKSISEFIDYAVTENRFKQGLENIFVNEPVDIKKMGDLIRWIFNDVVSEEIDTISNNGLTPKELGKSVSDRVRELFFAELNKF